MLTRDRAGVSCRSTGSEEGWRENTHSLLFLVPGTDWSAPSVTIDPPADFLPRVGWEGREPREWERCQRESTDLGVWEREAWEEN